MGNERWREGACLGSFGCDAPAILAYFDQGPVPSCVASLLQWTMDNYLILLCNPIIHVRVYMSSYGHRNRPHYGFYPSVCLALLHGLQTRKTKKEM